MDEELAMAGWQHNLSDGFIAHLGGLWHRVEGDQLQFGFVAAPIHANRNGVVHGGMLMAFADRAFGQTARHHGGASRAMTISLSHQFMNPMPLGAFAMLAPKVARVTGRLAFLEGTVMCDGQPILAAQGVWRVVRSPD